MVGVVGWVCVCRVWVVCVWLLVLFDVVVGIYLLGGCDVGVCVLVIYWFVCGVVVVLKFVGCIQFFEWFVCLCLDLFVCWGCCVWFVFRGVVYISFLFLNA